MGWIIESKLPGLSGWSSTALSGNLGPFRCRVPGSSCWFPVPGVWPTPASVHSSWLCPNALISEPSCICLWDLQMFRFIVSLDKFLCESQETLLRIKSFLRPGRWGAAASPCSHKWLTASLSAMGCLSPMPSESRSGRSAVFDFYPCGFWPITLSSPYLVAGLAQQCYREDPIWRPRTGHGILR